MTSEELKELITKFIQEKHNYSLSTNEAKYISNLIEDKINKYVNLIRDTEVDQLEEYLEDLQTLL